MTPPPFFPALIARLKTEEGCRLTAYEDTRGVLTIGYGHTGDNVYRGLVWAQQLADTVLGSDALEHGEQLEAAAPWIAALPEVRREVLWDMCFQLGVSGLLKFHDTLAACKSGNYGQAAAAMLNSAWAIQTPNRARALADTMDLGA